MTVRVAALTGHDIATVIPAAAALRIAVFRHWPYLYDGTMEYEEAYLSKFATAKGAVIVAAYDGDAVIGCATAAPMQEVEDEFSAPFREKGWDIARLNREFNQILQTAETRDRLNTLGSDIIGGEPKKLADYVRVEIPKWAKVIKESGARVD